MKVSALICSVLLLESLYLQGCTNAPTRRNYTASEPEVSITSNSLDLIKKAQTFYARGEYGNAVNTLNQIPEPHLHNTERTEYWNLKGLIRLGEKNYSAAILDFKKALTLNPVSEHQVYYQFNLASAFADSGKTIEASQTLNSMDIGTMGPNDQKKVAALKERLSKPVATKVNPTVGTLAPQAATKAIPTPAPVIEVYSGPVKEKRIGVLLPLSGKYENFGKKVQRAIELAFQTSTDPQSKNYELIAVDSGDSAETHQEALKKLVEEDQVIAVIGPVLGKYLDALRAKAAYYQVPLISVAQAQGATDAQVFSCSISARDQAAKMAEFAISTRGFKRFAILAPSNKAGEELASAFWEEVQSRNGEVRAFELYDPDLTDFREPVDKALGLFYPETRLKETQELAEKRKELKITKKTMKTLQYFALPPIVDFDAVFIADEARTVGQIIPTFAYRDAKGLPYFGISSWNSNQLIQRAGDQAEGASFPVAFNTQNPPPETKHFFDLYSTTYSAAPGELDAIAFDAAALVIQTLSDHPATRAEFTSKLENRGNIQGATGILSVKDHHCSRELSLYTVKKGAFEVIPSGETH